MTTAPIVDNDDWRTAQMLKESINYYKAQADPKYGTALRKERALYQEFLDKFIVGGTRVQ